LVVVSAFGLQATRANAPAARAMVRIFAFMV
jgi:hypothetical protein